MLKRNLFTNTIHPLVGIAMSNFTITIQVAEHNRENTRNICKSIHKVVSGNTTIVLSHNVTTEKLILLAEKV